MLSLSKIFTGSPRKELREAEDLIVNYYRHTPAALRLPLPNLDDAVLSTVCHGLGDTMMLTDLPRSSKGARSCFSTSHHFRPIMRFNRHWREPMIKPLLANAPDIVSHHACGNGHYLQRLQRAFDLPVMDVPRGCLYWKGVRNRHRVVMHFEPGVHAQWQREQIHPKARTLYPETRNALEKFIGDRRDLIFTQVGTENLMLRGTHFLRTPKTDDLVQAIAESAWFIGFMSGPMHIATALELKCVVLINFPEADKAFFPCLKDIGQIEGEWCYPQNAHLHQDGDGPLVKQATTANLHKAFDGKIYPYWTTDLCSLFHDPL